MVHLRDDGESRRLMTRHPSLSIAGVVAVLLVMATATAVAASSLEAPRCDGVKLRTGPSTADAVRAVIGTTTTVSVDTQVSGSTWQSLCAGHVLAGSRWARISSVNGKTVESQFGMAYLYAAAGLLQVLASASPTVAAPTAVAPTTAPPSASPPSPTTLPTVAPTAASPTTAPTPAPAASTAPSTVPVATQAGATPKASAGAAGPVTNQTGSPSDPLSNPAATVVLILAVLSTTLSWFALADRRRRRARRVAVPESVPATRLEDVLR